MNKIETKILELRNSAPATRTQIEELLKLIGKPGTKRKEKIEAVKELNLSTNENYKVEDDLTSYGGW